MLKWLRSRVLTVSSSIIVPSAFMRIGGWNISPAFSSRVICASRSSTRSSTGRVGSS
jgi:hypothetical protein